LDRFLESNSKWLEGKVNFPHRAYQATPSSFQRVSASVGCPTKPFVESSSRSKKHKTKPLLYARSAEELTYAAQMVLRFTGKRGSANIIKELTLASPQRGMKLKRATEISKWQPTVFTGEKALALFIDAKLTTEQYDTV
jgi:hypothetical protein